MQQPLNKSRAESMAENEKREEIIKLYDQFIRGFLLEGNSILTDHELILTPEKIQGTRKCYISGFISNSTESFDEKIQKQFKDADIETKLVFAHAVWLWAYSVFDIKQETKKEYTLRATGLLAEALNPSVYPKGYGSAGQWHVQNKYNEIRFTFLIIEFVREKIEAEMISNPEEVKKWIEYICLFQAYGVESERYIIPETLKGELPEEKLAMVNILPYNGAPKRYQRIATVKHKEMLYNSFKSLLSDKTRNDTSLNLDEKIYEIKLVLQELGEPEDLDFWHPKYLKIWNYSSSSEGLDELQALEYKKAIILYGPPGTSKTYNAKRLARSLIMNTFLKNKDNVKRYFENEKLEQDNTEKRIWSLQLHQNYTYEDFVIGYQFQNNSTEVVEGLLFEICDKAEKDDLPHVLILDEINRIDLSRLFGEVFSAMENRGEKIKLSVGGRPLSIPDNLYIIGTMNEIDFSLEQLDFALRRRFLWYFYGFNETILKDIIEHKCNDEDTKVKIRPDDVERFVNNAKKLNEEISKVSELGKQYQIGHTFFGEIVDIYKSYKETESKKSHQIYRANKTGPVAILWNISLQPMLEAFLGNIPPKSVDRVVDILKTVYFTKKVE